MPVNIVKRIWLNKYNPDIMDRNILASLHFFGMDESDITKGLVYLKNKVKHEFRKYAMRFHPDRNIILIKGREKSRTGFTFKKALKHYRRLMKMKTVPITIDNANAVLNITKGYLSTNDIEIPTHI